METTAVQTKSAKPSLRFEHLTMRDGLSQNGVICLLQDRRGYIWIGTEDGLNRYDGTGFKVYNHSPEKASRSLTSGDVHSLFEDQAGTLWAGTYDRGLNRYDRLRDEFHPFEATPETRAAGTVKSSASEWNELYILTMCEFPNGVLWLGCGQGLVRVDVQAGSYRKLSFSAELSLVYSLLPLAQQNAILIGSVRGLLLFDLQSQELKTLEYPPGPVGSEQQVATSLKFRDRNSVWILSVNGRLFILNLHDLTLDEQFLGTELCAEKAHFAGLAIDYRGDVWITFSKGLARIKGDDPSQCEIYRSHADDPKGLPHEFLQFCLIDSAGSLWCASRAGVAVAHLERKTLELYDSFVLTSLGAESAYVNSLAVDGQGILWIGSAGGLYSLEPVQSEFKCYGLTSETTELQNDIMSLAVDKLGRIILGYDCGYAIYDPLVNEIVESQSVNSMVVCMLVTKAGDLMAGVAHAGLMLRTGAAEDTKFNKHNPDDPATIASDYVLALLEDQDGRIWVGTTKGLQIFDQASGRFEHCGTQSSNNFPQTVLSLFQSSDARIWVAATNGLFVISDPAESTAPRPVSLGLNLPSRVLYSIEEDEDKKLWIASNSGLIHYDLSSGRSRIYGMDDNAQNSEFNLNAHARLLNGSLAFGGPGGINIVRPHELRDNQHLPPVILSDLKLFNKSVPVFPEGQGGFNLPAVVGELDRIQFSWRESVFSLECVALDFVNPGRNRYAWKLEGWDREWVDAGSARQATYTNLDAGDYVFRVRASNNDGIWNRDGAKLHIRITPPPWKTWWAYSAYASAGLASILAYTRARVAEQTRQIEAQNAIERAKVEERENMRRKNAADFHDEAGNKLTKIMLYTELVKRNSDNPKVNELMAKIELNAGGLSSGMRDFIWVLDPARDTLSDTVARLQDFGAGLFQDVAVDFAVDVDQLQIHGERLALEVRRELLLIFKEAMHNTLKYAESKHALLSVRLKSSVLSVAFVDDGIGFDPSIASKGFGLRSMRTRAAKISAELVLRTAVGQGTALAVSLNLPPAGPGT